MIDEVEIKEEQKPCGNGADGISDIEGKATRVGASERGQRTSFNGADGISDPPSPRLRRAKHRRKSREGSDEQVGQRASFNNQSSPKP
jgi:hypothetical protein